MDLSSELGAHTGLMEKEAGPLSSTLGFAGKWGGKGLELLGKGYGKALKSPLTQKATIAASPLAAAGVNEGAAAVGLPYFGGKGMWSPSMHKYRMDGQNYGLLSRMGKALGRPIQTAGHFLGLNPEAKPQDFWDIDQKGFKFDPSTGKMTYTGSVTPNAEAKRLVERYEASGRHLKGMGLLNKFDGADGDSSDTAAPNSYLTKYRANLRHGASPSSGII